MDRSKYPKDWEQLATAVKIAADWKCQYCGVQCLRPEDDRSKLSRSQIAKRTIQAHHTTFVREHRHGVKAICSDCHLKIHRRNRGSIHPKQLSLDLDKYIA